MLEIVSRDFLKASNYLLDNYPTDKRLIVHVMEGYDTIETPIGKGFGVFIPETLEIFIAGDMPGESEDLIKTLAHEFKHFLQYCDGKPFDETEAEEFAEEIYKKVTAEKETSEEGGSFERADCDTCVHKYMYQGDIEACRRRDKELDCQYKEREVRICPVCEKEVYRDEMNYTKDCHGITFRLVCYDCYIRLMAKGYDGEYYDELDEQIEADY